MKQRSNVIEKFKGLLLIWINEEQLDGDTVAETIIGEFSNQNHPVQVQNVKQS